MQELVSLLPIVGIFLIFWLLVIRPASRRQKAMAQMQGGLNLGDDVVLTSGIHGTVRDLVDDVVLVEIADGVQIRVARAAIGQVGRAEPVERDDELAQDDDETTTEQGTDLPTHEER